MRVVEEVRRFMAERSVAGGGVVAVSGGADSVALLRALIAAGCGPLTAAHLNHQLRGTASDEDEAFVGELAASLGVAFRSTRIDVAAAAAQVGENLEASARKIRYEWLAKIADEVEANWIATGHTADDQAETVLHRLIRGTGLQGLRGIAAVLAPLSSTHSIIRPLLAVRRTDIVEYLSSLGQPFREDVTNLDPRFTRNRIRAELLPLLKTFNPEVLSILGRLAEQAGEAHALISEQAQSLLLRAERPRAGHRIILDSRQLTGAPTLVLTAALRLVWEREGWPMGEMTAEHWNRVAQVARGNRAAQVARGNRAACELPGGIIVRTAAFAVQLERKTDS